MTEPSLNRNLRVMQIITRMNIGGTAIYVTLIEEYLRKRGYEMQLVSGVIDDDEGDMLYYAETHGVTPIIVPEIRRSLHPIRDLIAIWKVYRLIRKFKPDVVHTNTAKAGFVGRTAAWLARVPVILHTFHGHVFEGHFSESTTRFFVQLEKITAWMSTRIITLTPRLQDELSQKYGITSTEKIVVQPLGIELDEFAQQPRKEGRFRTDWNIATDDIVLGKVCRLVPIKNHMLFLNVAARVLKEFPNTKWVIVGDGETRPQLEARTDELGIRDNVIFTGWQRGGMAHVFSDFDLMVMTSNNEGTPIAMIEAMATGCPVISTDVGGIPDLLLDGELGQLVPKGDEDAIVDAVIATLNDMPDSEAVREATLRVYQVDRLIDDLDGLYTGLVAEKR